MFNPIAYFESRGIQHWTTGKNVTQGWVNIQCVYPGCDDASNHLGTSLSTGLHSCWKCGRKGGPEQLVMAIEHCSYGEAAETVRRFSSGPIPIAQHRGSVREATGAFMLPKTATWDLPGPHARYLLNRGFDLDHIQQEYHVMACYTVGRYRHRVIIPIYLNGVLVNFIARDITGKAEKKYLMAPNREALVPGEQLLYNLDRAGRSVALVEGATDVWRIGPGAVGVLGTKLTEEKISLLPQRGVERAFVVYDQDAAERGMELAWRVSKLVKHVENIWLPAGDPDAYFAENPSDLAELRFLLG